jgi:hypothetical protein
MNNISLKTREYYKIDVNDKVNLYICELRDLAYAEAGKVKFDQQLTLTHCQVQPFQGW